MAGFLTAGAVDRSAIVQGLTMLPMARSTDLRLGGVTAAEAEVARLVVPGRGMPFVADSHGIGLDTARTHPKSVCDRTGVNPRAALARAIPARFPPPRGLSGD